MIRPILLVSLAAAGLTLAACDQTSILAKAEPGECYQVSGKDSLGKPQFVKADCSAPGVAATATDANQTASADGASPATAMVSGTSAATTAQCPDPQAAREALVAACAQLASSPTTAPSYVESSTVRPKVAASASTARRRAATATASRSSRSSSTARSNSNASSSSSYDSSLDYASTGSGSVRQFASGQVNQSVYAAQSSYSASSASYSASSSSSSSYSASGSASYGNGYGYDADCGCDGQARGPRGPFDRNGFLTWPGKVPARY